MTRLITKSEVCERLGVSRSTLHRWMDAGAFPAPRQIGPRAVRWPEDQVNDWIDSRPAARSEG